VKRLGEKLCCESDVERKRAIEKMRHHKHRQKQVEAFGCQGLFTGEGGKEVDG